MNKNFIPEKFLQKKNREEKQSIKRGLVILLVGNLIMLPINISNIMKIKNAEKDNSLESVDNINPLDRKKEILKWAEVLKLYANSGEIKDNSGDMLIKDDRYLNEIKDKVNIIEINNDDSGYAISVIGDRK